MVAIEGFEIIRELSHGGQGIVYEAVQKSTKRKVAIKVLLEGIYASKSAQRRFEREIDAHLRSFLELHLVHKRPGVVGRDHHAVIAGGELPLERRLADRSAVDEHRRP